MKSRSREIRNTLKAEIKGLLKMYEKRKKSNSKDGHITAGQATKSIITAATIGGIAGTPIPIIGNAIGMLAGAVVGAVAVGCEKLHQMWMEKKRKNADKVSKFFRHDRKIIIGVIVDDIIEKYGSLLEKLEDTERNKSCQYLVQNIMAAVKYKKGLKEEVINEGLCKPQSSKFRFKFFANKLLDSDSNSNGDKALTVKPITQPKV